MLQRCQHKRIGTRWCLCCWIVQTLDVPKGTLRKITTIVQGLDARLADIERREQAVQHLEATAELQQV